MVDGPKTSLGALAALLEREAAAPAPVERWNPPYCGDIGLAIRGDGVWEYRGSPIQRPAMVKLFARVLRRDPDGRFYLVTPAEKVDIAVADAPFMAVEMEAEGRGRERALVLRTNVDDIVRCGRGHPLRFARQEPGDGLKPYVLVRGRLEALLTRALTYELAELVTVHPQTGATGVWSGGEFFGI